jgi:hypothetical protein
MLEAASAWKLAGFQNVLFNIVPKLIDLTWGFATNVYKISVRRSQFAVVCNFIAKLLFVERDKIVAGFGRGSNVFVNHIL